MRKFESFGSLTSGNHWTVRVGHVSAVLPNVRKKQRSAGNGVHTQESCHTRRGCSSSKSCILHDRLAWSHQCTSTIRDQCIPSLTSLSPWSSSSSCVMSTPRCVSRDRLKLGSEQHTVNIDIHARWRCHFARVSRVNVKRQAEKMLARGLKLCRGRFIFEVAEAQLWCKL